MTARRLEWMDQWRALAARGEVSAEEASRELDALLDDVTELQRRVPVAAATSPPVAVRTTAGRVPEEATT